MQNEKFLFDNDGSVDKTTGELRAKEFSVTCNVIDGTKSNFPPKAIVTFKLGNESFKLIAEDFDSIAEAIYKASNFIQNNASKGNNTVREERKKWGEIQAHTNNVRSKAG